MSDAAQTFQITPEQAEAYEANFVPALFRQWAELIVAAAGVGAGDRVLDVACGTGIVARLAAGAGATVTGVDLNPAMLTVARRVGPEIDWYQGDVVKLPFGDGVFTKVLCQSALMFFPGPVAALTEMARVSAPDGVVAVQVYSSIEAQPAYRPFVELVARETGPHARALMGTYWRCGDLGMLRGEFAAAGLEVTEVITHLGHAMFPSVEALVATEVGATPLAQEVSDPTMRRIVEGSRELLGRFLTPAGELPMPIEGHIVVGRRYSSRL